MSTVLGIALGGVVYGVACALIVRSVARSVDRDAIWDDDEREWLRESDRRERALAAANERDQSRRRRGVTRRWKWR